MNALTTRLGYGAAVIKDSININANLTIDSKKYQHYWSADYILQTRWAQTNSALVDYMHRIPCLPQRKEK